MKKNNIFKRISLSVLAFAFALCCVIFPYNNKDYVVLAEEVEEVITLNFPKVTILTAVCPVNSTFTNGKGGAFNVEYNLSVSVNSNYVNNVDKSTFAISFFADLYNINDNYDDTVVDRLNLDIQNDLGVASYYTRDIYFMNDELQYVNYPFENNSYRSFFNAIGGAIFSQSMYRYEFLRNQYISNITFMQTYTRSFSLSNSNNNYLIYYDYLYNDSAYFDWNRVDKMRRVELAFDSMKTIQYNGVNVDFNNLTILDYTYNNYASYYRFVFPSFSFNNATTVSEYVFNRTSVDNYEYQLGYDLGYREGLNVNTEGSYNKGYNDGFVVGENVGYENGLNKQENQFTNLITAVIDVPIKTFLSLFDINIFGYDLKAFVISLFSIALVISIVRFVT